MLKDLRESINNAIYSCVFSSKAKEKIWDSEHFQSMNGTIIKTNVLQLIALVSFQQSAYPQDISARNYHPPLDEYRVL